MLILPQHPRSNGLVERTNGVLVQGVLRLLAAIPGATWEDVLPDVLAGVRFLPHRLGYAPYLATFKQFPRCLNEAYAKPIPAIEGDLDVADDTAYEQYLAASVRWWEDAIEEIRARIQAGDDKMIEHYKARH